MPPAVYCVGHLRQNKERLSYRAYLRTEIVRDRESRRQSIAGYPRVELH